MKLTNEEEEEKEILADIEKQINEASEHIIEENPKTSIPEEAQEKYEHEQWLEQQKNIEELSTKLIEDLKRDIDNEWLRDEIKEKIENFIQTDKKALLIRAIPGIGKTVTTGNALMGRDEVHAVLLGQSHEAIAQSRENIKNITGIRHTHIKGRGKRDDDDNPLCKYSDLINKIEDTFRGINITDIICKKCPTGMKCKYFQLIDEIHKGKSWFGVHQHCTGTNYVRDSHEKSNKKYKITIIDENFFSNIHIKAEITDEDLETFREKLSLIQLETTEDDSDKLTTVIQAILIVVASLRDLLKVNYEKIENEKFIHELNIRLTKRIHEPDILPSIGRYNYRDDILVGVSLDGIDNIHLILDSFSWAVDIIRGLYNKKLKEIYKKVLEEKNLDYGINDIFDPIIKIIDFVYTYRNFKDFNFPVYIGQKEKAKKIIKTVNINYIDFEHWKDKFSLEKFIFLDGTTAKEIYELFFKNMNWSYEILEQDFSKVKIPTIYQITDGYYWKESLKYYNTIKRIAQTIKLFIQKYNITKDRIVICTYENSILRDENFSNIFNEELKNELKNIEFIYFGNLRGMDKFKDFSLFISIGIHEPNIRQLVKEVCAWYEGLKKIDVTMSNEKEHTYSDSRLTPFVESQRIETEQFIGRSRFVLDPNNKTILVICKYPIKYTAKKLKVEELIKIMKSEKIINIRDKILETFKTHGDMSITEIYNLVKGDYKEFKKEFKNLVDEEIVKKAYKDKTHDKPKQTWNLK